MMMIMYSTYLLVTVHVFVGFGDQVPNVVEGSAGVNVVTQRLVDVHSDKKNTKKAKVW